MIKPIRSPGRVVAQTAIKAILEAGFCEDAVIGILQSPAERFRQLSHGEARFRDDELEMIEYATGRTAYDWALTETLPPMANTGRPASAPA